MSRHKIHSMVAMDEHKKGVEISQHLLHQTNKEDGFQMIRHRLYRYGSKTKAQSLK